MRPRHFIGAGAFLVLLLAAISMLWQTPDLPPYAEGIQVGDSTWYDSPHRIVISASIRNQKILDAVPGVQCVHSVEDGDSVVWYFLPEGTTTRDLHLTPEP